MALNTSKCNHLTPLRFKRLILVVLLTISQKHHEYYFKEMSLVKRSGSQSQSHSQYEFV